jgi:hypothetical protein
MEIGLGSMVRKVSDVVVMCVTGEAGDDLFCVSEDGALRGWFSRHELTRVLRKPGALRLQSAAA